MSAEKMVVCSALVLLVTQPILVHYLCWLQMAIGRNVTTNEVLKGAFSRSDGRFVNPYDRGLVGNCFRFWCSRDPRSWVGRKKKGLVVEPQMLEEALLRDSSEGDLLRDSSEGDFVLNSLDQTSETQEGLDP